MKQLPKLLSVLLPLLAVPSVVVPSAASAAPNAPDLVAAVVASGSTLVNTATHIDVRLTNIGNRDASAVTIAIQLPKTNTSPGVYVMGTLSNVPTFCPRTGTRLLCTLSQPVRRNGGTATVGFDLAMPVSTAPLSIRVDANTSNDRNLANNSADFTAVQTYYSPAVQLGGAAVTNSHCTGTNLTSYFECELFPGSLQSHLATLVVGGPNAGTIDLSANGPEAAGMGGTWSVTGSQLTMQYTDGATPIGNFVGQGSTPNCWDGKMSFVPSGESMYRVCL